jgi:DNA-binding NarL/FixJ family response regulator
LTTSSEEQEILNMYRLRCSSYIVKPVDFDQFVQVVRAFSDYWLRAVVLPSGLPPIAAAQLSADLSSATRARQPGRRGAVSDPSRDPSGSRRG